MIEVHDQITEVRPQRFRRYPSYKASGVEWLGEIPVHWEVARIAELTTLHNGYPFESAYFAQDEGTPLVRIRDLHGTEAEVGYVGPVVEDAWIDFGDVIIGMDGDFNVARWRGQPALLNQRLCCLRARSDADSAFVAYVLPLPLRMINDRTHSTTVKHLSSNSVRKIRIGAPVGTEQRAIAAFLDCETARIDGLVERKERLIELLQEKRTALITHAVTRGLDLNVPMKDSGVEWLGEIPEHWGPARLWRLCNATSGATPAKENPVYWNGEIPWVSPKDMKRRVIVTSEDLITRQALDETGIKLITPQVVLIVVRGMILAHSFPVAVTSVSVTINQDMKALRLIDGIDTIYFAWALDGLAGGIIATVVEEAAHGTRAIRMDQWRNVVVPLPPHSEQRAIAAFLDRETAKIDTLIGKIRRAVDLLRESRTALISAAVTGKIDIREETA